jgi:hypothetical protein
MFLDVPRPKDSIDGPLCLETVRLISTQNEAGAGSGQRLAGILKRSEQCPS